MPENYLFTSESVTEGHPDKICDKISDAILDACFAQDPKSRVACETSVKTGLVLLAGEITTTANVDFEKIARDTVLKIGYDHSAKGFDGETCAVLNALSSQSLDISQGVDEGDGLHKEQGAGDQGMMFGYAIDETPVLMPATIYWAHRLTEALTEARRDGRIGWARPDGKSQVTIEYVDGEVARIDSVVISTQHSEEVTHEQIVAGIKKEVILPTLPAELLDAEAIYVEVEFQTIGGATGDDVLFSLRPSGANPPAPRTQRCIGTHVDPGQSGGDEHTCHMWVPLEGTGTVEYLLSRLNGATSIGFLTVKAVAQLTE